MWHTRRMNTPPPTNLYTGPRFPAEIISHGVWPSCRFCLSYRDVAELMAERGVILTHEAGQYWGRAFGQAYANQLRRRRPRPGDTWHLDEVFLTINGQRHYLWRAGDQVGRVLATLVQRQQRQRERRQGRFKSRARAQRFLSAYGPVAQHLPPRRRPLASVPGNRLRMRYPAR